MTLQSQPLPADDELPTRLDRSQATRKRRRARRDRERRGAATVEMALVLPVMMFIVLGSLEICQRLMLRQAAAVSAYETARLAARRTTTAETAVARGESILTGRRIEGGQVTISPNNLAELATGEELTVTVSIPITGNTPITYALPVSGPITISASMLRE